MKNCLVLRLKALMSVTMNSRTVRINAKKRLALGDSKNIRSTQYWRIHKDMDARIARTVHNFPLNKPHKSTAPAIIQPTPVMERYSGLRRASNSFSTFHQRSTAISRTAPHADRLNTSHRSRVTPNGRLRIMDLGSHNDKRGFRWTGRSFILRGMVVHELLTTIIDLERHQISVELTLVGLLVQDDRVGKHIVESNTLEILSTSPSL